MPSPFTIEVDTETEGYAVIHLDGAVDAHTAPQFEQAVQDVIDDGRLNIIVDCARLTYISSAGLGVFMGFIEEVRDEGGDIKICGLTEKVKQPFDILGFDALFDFCPDAAGAIDKFSQPAGEGGA